MPTQLFPGATEYQDMIKIGSNLVIDLSRLPYVPLAPLFSVLRFDQHFVQIK